MIIPAFIGLIAHVGAQNTYQIQKKLDSLVQANAIPGVIVGITQNGKRQFLQAGFSNVLTQTPMHEELQLEIGSITKTFTAYLLTKVLLERKISDTSRFTMWLPDSVQRNDKISSKSFLQLLNHTAGLPRLPTNLKGTSEQPYRDYQENNLYSYLVTAQPQTSNEVLYSNLGMGLAGQLACILSGRSYSALLDQYITRPLGLRTTGLVANPNKPICTGYMNKQVVPFWKMDVLQGAGAIKSTSKDMLTYLEFIIANEEEPVVKVITTPTAKVNERLKIARGWHWSFLPNQQSILWHNGGTFGFSTFCGIDFKTKTAVFIAVNAFNANQYSDAVGIAILKNLR